MLLGGLALVFSRLIDNGVIVLENIFRFMEMGVPPREAAEKGGKEVAMAVLAATFTTAIVFFPVTFFSGISKYIFTPLALGVVLSIFASYFFAMTVVPLFCAKFVRLDPEGMQHEGDTEAVEGTKPAPFKRFLVHFNRAFRRFLDWYEKLALPRHAAARVYDGSDPGRVGRDTGWPVSLPWPRLLSAHRSRPVHHQRAHAQRTRLEVSNNYMAKVEDVIRSVVKPKDLDMIVSNIGVYPDLSAIYTPNASMDTAFVQASLKEDHSVGSYKYMREVQDKLARQMPELTTYAQAGGLVDGVVNQGLPAPIDIQIQSNDHGWGLRSGTEAGRKIRSFPDVSDVYIPQNLDYPGIQLNIDREKASLIGLSTKDVVDNVITAMTSDGMVAPSYWIDPKSGNNYMVTVQYANRFLNNMSMEDFNNIPLRGTHPAGYSPANEARAAGDLPSALFMGDHTTGYTPLSSVADIQMINTPTEVDHYQIRRVIDIYVATKTEALQGVERGSTSCWPTRKPTATRCSQCAARW